MAVEGANGAALDGCCWYFFGGGPRSHGGNEVDAFELETLIWSRLTDLTPYRPGSTENPCPRPSAAGNPVPGRALDGPLYSLRSGTLLVWAGRPYCGRTEPVRRTARLGDAQRFGVAQDSERDTLFLWDGGREVYTADPETRALGCQAAPIGVAPVARSAGLPSRWTSVPSADVVMGMNNPHQEGKPIRTAADAVEAVEERPIRTCGRDGTCREFVLLSDALAALQPGGEVVLPPGVHRQAGTVAVPNATIRGEIGPNGERAHLTGATVQGKAALVVAPGADHVRIIGIACSGIRVPDRNGACLRLEAPNATIKDVYVHDNQIGILGGGLGGRIVIEGSRFERNGAGGGSHQLYISKRVAELVVRDNRILSTMGWGHAVKSRAARTVVEGNLIAGLDGPESRTLDVPNGGELVVRDNVLVKGVNSENWDVISVAKESEKSGLHERNAILVERNTFVFERSGVVFTSDSPATIEFRDNVIMGDARIVPPRFRVGEVLRGARKSESPGRWKSVEEHGNRWIDHIPADRNYDRLREGARRGR